MTPEQIRIALESRMIAWTDAPLAFDGAIAPPSVQSAQDAKAPWCRVSIQDGAAEIATHGGIVRRDGLLFVQVFTDDGSGSAPARQLASSLAAHLTDYRDGSLILGASALAVVGPADGWYQINVQTPWRVHG